MADGVLTSTPGYEWDLAWHQMIHAKKGFNRAMLTNWANSSVCQIESGSSLELMGTMFKLTTNEDITPAFSGLAISTQYYIRTYWDSGTSTAKFEWTSDASTWNSAKGGYYDSDEIKRYLGGAYKDSGGNCTRKFLYLGQDYYFPYAVFDYGDITDGTVYKKMLDINGSGHPTLIDNACTFETARTRYFTYSLTGAGFNFGISTAYAAQQRGDFAYWSNLASTSYPSYGAVNLPHGAVCQYLRTKVEDDTTSVNVTLKRSPHTGSSSQTMATKSGSGTVAVGSYATIDNDSYAYFFEFKSSVTNKDIWKVQIEYTITEARQK